MTKDQHYIPKFYLKGFTDTDKTLWVCERFKPIRPSKPKNEAHRPDYYTHSENGGRGEIAEDMLLRIESVAAPIIRKIGNPQYQLTRQLAGNLYMFVAFMFARVPSMREYSDQISSAVAKKTHLEYARDKARFHASCATFESSSGKSLGIDYEELRQHFLKGNYEFVQSSVAFNLGTMFDSAFHVLDQLMTFNYEILYAPPAHFFLTSDAPVMTVKPDGDGMGSVGVGFGWDGVEVIFPLNRRACLLLRREEHMRSHVISERALESINNLTMHCADRFVFSAEGHRRIARLFDERGSRVKPGVNAFMMSPNLPSNIGGK
ncbi:MAG TPA: DUF4238 domain-containing protein [Candidatus Angelobacter sp.]